MSRTGLKVGGNVVAVKGSAGIQLGNFAKACIDGNNVGSSSSPSSGTGVIEDPDDSGLRVSIEVLVLFLFVFFVGDTDVSSCSLFTY